MAVSIDGDLVGYGYVYVLKPEGSHWISVEDPVWDFWSNTYDYLGYFSDGLGNGDYREVYSDIYVTAWYYIPEILRQIFLPFFVL